MTCELNKRFIITSLIRILTSDNEFSRSFQKFIEPKQSSTTVYNGGK